MKVGEVKLFGSKFLIGTRKLNKELTIRAARVGRENTQKATYLVIGIFTQE